MMRNQLMIKFLAISVLLLSLVACSDADLASRNLSTAADYFEINRRIVFYNGITGDYILSIQGACSLGNNDPDKKLTVTCKTGKNDYKKHYLGLSDNVTYFVEQLDSSAASVSNYRVVFKPSAIIPDIEVK